MGVDRNTSLGAPLFLGDSPGSVLAVLWTTALPRYLELHASALVANQRVLDLGGGIGLASIVAISLGAREVVYVDLSPSASQMARLNAAKNLPTARRARLAIRTLDFCREPLMGEGGAGLFDTVLMVKALVRGMLRSRVLPGVLRNRTRVGGHVLLQNSAWELPPLLSDKQWQRSFQAVRSVEAWRLGLEPVP